MLQVRATTNPTAVICRHLRNLVDPTFLQLEVGIRNFAQAADDTGHL